MNAVTENRAELGPLAAYLDAARVDTPGQTATDRTQAALLRRIEDQAVRAHRPSSRWPRLAWAAPALAVVVATAILLAGGPGGPRPAFAEVQRYFSDFQTLYAQTRMEVPGQAGLGMEIYLKRGGRTRIDMAGEFSYIIDPEAGAMLMLMHRPATAQRIEIPVGSSAREELEWLDEIRQFQGEAELLPQQETILGRLADGYRLDQNGHALIVWAAADDGTPLRVDGQFGGGGMNMTIEFKFDQTFDDRLFELQLPPGYRWLQPGQEAG